MVPLLKAVLSSVPVVNEPNYWNSLCGKLEKLLKKAQNSKELHVMMGYDVSRNRVGDYGHLTLSVEKMPLSDLLDPERGDNSNNAIFDNFTHGGFK